MNFLAHLWLADRSDTSLAGSVLGDVVRGADLSAYPPQIATGVRLHRRVDAATDRHAVMRRERDAFAAGDRRYAGIVLDLAADHALAQAWATLHPEPLPDFARRCAQAMADAGDWFEFGGGRRPTREGFADLLVSYGTEAGIEHALRRTATRLRDPQGLIDSGRRWREASRSLREPLPGLLADLLALMRAD